MASKHQQGSLRIIAGRWKRQTIHFVGPEDLRPTPNMVRETLFNWLAPVIEGASCLDLFSGSGALGFEAASRGAGRVDLVHRRDDLADDLAAARGRRHGGLHELVGGAGRIGRLAHGAGQLAHRRGRVLQVAGGLLGALAQCAEEDLRARRR